MLFPGLLLLHSLFPNYYIARTFCDCCQLFQHSSGLGFFSVLMMITADCWYWYQIQMAKQGWWWGSKMEDEKTKNPLLQSTSFTNMRLSSCEWIKLLWGQNEVFNSYVSIAQIYFKLPKQVEYSLVDIMYMAIINKEFWWKILNHFYLNFYKLSFSFIKHTKKVFFSNEVFNIQ